MRKFIVTCSLILAIVIAVLVEYYCSPWKSYFTMSLTAVFFIYWGVEFVLDYVAYKKEWPAKFEYFAAEKVNKYDIPLEQIEQNRKKYFAQFKRSILGERLGYIAKFLVSFGAALALIIGMCF